MPQRWRGAVWGWRPSQICFSFPYDSRPCGCLPRVLLSNPDLFGRAPPENLLNRTPIRGRDFVRCGFLFFFLFVGPLVTQSGGQWVNSAARVTTRVRGHGDRSRASLCTFIAAKGFRRLSEEIPKNIAALSSEIEKQDPHLHLALTPFDKTSPSSPQTLFRLLPFVMNLLI